MIVEYYIEQQSFDLCYGCFDHDPYIQKQSWCALSYWLVPGTFKI